MKTIGGLQIMGMKQDTIMFCVKLKQKKLKSEGYRGIFVGLVTAKSIIIKHYILIMLSMTFLDESG